MFGIIGYGINKDDQRVFRDLMVMSALRGIDSTGVAFGGSLNKQRVIKKLGDPIWFLQNLTKSEEKDLDNLSHNFCLGHTRWATKGDNTIQAAQPFNYSRVMGTHNGTLDTQFKGFNSDSDELFSNIDVYGVDKTVSLLKKNDSYAIVYFDKKLNTVNFLNNGKRKLYYSVNEKRDTMYYASENGILIAALWRNGIDAKPYYFSEDHLFSVRPHALKAKGELLFESRKVAPLEAHSNLPPFIAGHEGEPATDV